MKSVVQVSNSFGGTRVFQIVSCDSVSQQNAIFKGLMQEAETLWTVTKLLTRYYNILYKTGTNYEQAIRGANN